jgi:hypothetical protein
MLQKKNLLEQKINEIQSNVPENTLLIQVQFEICSVSLILKQNASMIKKRNSN